MRKEKIVATLLACAAERCECYSCPYHEKRNCYDLLMLDAADCITRMIKDNRTMAMELQKQKLSSVYGEVRNAEAD